MSFREWCWEEENKRLNQEQEPVEPQQNNGYEPFVYQTRDGPKSNPF